VSAEGGEVEFAQAGRVGDHVVGADATGLDGDRQDEGQAASHEPAEADRRTPYSGGGRGYADYPIWSSATR
jgi:hypothetical protein